MQPRPLKQGEIVQINPEYQPARYGGLLLVVDKPKSFGCVGHLALDGANFTYLRLGFADIEPTGGIAHWLAEPVPDDDTAPEAAAPPAPDPTAAAAALLAQINHPDLSTPLEADCLQEMLTNPPVGKSTKGALNQLLLAIALILHDDPNGLPHGAPPDAIREAIPGLLRAMIDAAIQYRQHTPRIRMPPGAAT